MSQAYIMEYASYLETLTEQERCAERSVSKGKKKTVSKQLDEKV